MLDFGKTLTFRRASLYNRNFNMVVDSQQFWIHGGYKARQILTDVQYSRTVILFLVYWLEL
jgi:hypothetical protein